MVKKIILKLIDIDVIKQFYYPFEINKLKLRYQKAKFKFLGKGVYIDFPVKINVGCEK